MNRAFQSQVAFLRKKMMNLLVMLMVLATQVDAFIPNPRPFMSVHTGASRGSWKILDGVKISLNNSLIRQTDYLRNPKADVIKDSVSVDPNKCLVLLQDALSSSTSKAAASELLEKISLLRKETTEASDSAFLDLMTSLLDNGPDSQRLPFWTNIRFLGRFSKRARWASLRRTLNLTTPPRSSEIDENEQPIEERRRRRMRALVSILRSLSTDNEKDGSYSGKQLPPIVVLEKKARVELQRNKCIDKRDRNGEDLTSRRPEGLETPNYSVVEKKSGTFEIRRYEDFAVCSVPMTKERPSDSSRTDAKISEPTLRGASAFEALAGYLFGKNEQNLSMKMTTPVLTNTRFLAGESSSGNSDGKKEKLMSFVLPSEYWKDESVLATAPQPLEGSGVSLERFEGADRAVVMFGGYASEKVIEQQTKLLLQELEQSSSLWKVPEGETVSVAQYNDPFTPPWKRLNEVSVAVELKE